MDFLHSLLRSCPSSQYSCHGEIGTPSSSHNPRVKKQKRLRGHLKLSDMQTAHEELLSIRAHYDLERLIFRAAGGL
jgi:hypothetical protein